MCGALMAASPALWWDSLDAGPHRGGTRSPDGGAPCTGQATSLVAFTALQAAAMALVSGPSGNPPPPRRLAPSCGFGAILRFWRLFAVLAPDCGFGALLRFWRLIAVLAPYCGFGALLRFWRFIAVLAPFCGLAFVLHSARDRGNGRKGGVRPHVASCTGLNVCWAALFVHWLERVLGGSIRARA